MGKTKDSYTIQEFWMPRLGRPTGEKAKDFVDGWSFVGQGYPTFVEAPLTQSTEEFGDDVDPKSCTVILVSAPGAVGKSTLARQIASATGSIYVDLSKSDPVAGNALSGGLIKSDVYSLWTDGRITALIDGLDEALLKTTAEGFEAFLKDVADLSVNRNIPTVLFGRTGAVQDAWLHLYDNCDGNVAVLEIGYYDSAKSLKLAKQMLYQSDEDRIPSEVDSKALELLLDGLRNQTESDGNRFAGYAPVLQAVAKHVEEEKNPHRLVSKLEQGEQATVTLHYVVDAVMSREKGKLHNLHFREPEIIEKLYTPKEQLERLIARFFDATPPSLPEMNQEDADTYSRALESWVNDHPFLDGDTGTPSAVFEAVICAQALKGKTEVSRKAVERELAKGEAANPFLYLFYMEEDSESGPSLLPEEHIGVVYSSVRAGLAQGETASLSIEEPEDDDESETCAVVEIQVSRQSSHNQFSLQFETYANDTIRLGPHIRNVYIDVPSSSVEIGLLSEVLLVAPVFVRCKELEIYANKVIADGTPDSPANVIYLQAEQYGDELMIRPPVARNGVELRAAWPGAEHYPWTGYYVKPSSVPIEDPHVDEGLRRLRKFVVAFRKHGKEAFARSKRKIDSPRMTKGTGRAVLESMLSAGIVTLYQEWYFLHTDTLNELTGTGYLGFTAYDYDAKAVEFVKDALKGYSIQV